MGSPAAAPVSLGVDCFNHRYRMLVSKYTFRYTSLVARKAGVNQPRRQWEVTYLQNWELLIRRLNVVTALSCSARRGRCRNETVDRCRRRRWRCCARGGDARGGQRPAGDRPSFGRAQEHDLPLAQGLAGRRCCCPQGQDNPPIKYDYAPGGHWSRSAEVVVHHLRVTPGPISYGASERQRK